MKYLAIILLGLITFASCQKSIDIDLNEANPVVVIEANFTAEDSTVRVLITETSNFFSGDEEPTIDDAVVTITNQAGVSQQVPFVSEGLYTLENYIPEFNSTYTMTVFANGVTYTATCDMLPVIDQQGIIFDSIPPGPFSGDGGYVVAVTYQDPPEEGNFTSTHLVRNGKELKKLNDIVLNDDQLTNGNLVIRPLFVKFFDLGDTVEIELRTINEKIHDYYVELSSLTDPNSAAPANPDYLWENRALGFFNAYPSSRQSVVIQ
ncbi:MAG: DUF4249 family protein [Crocinitomicaceae bacterium]|nr:DUF4249 family protein [Crocinitomicaceae bacterium]